MSIIEPFKYILGALINGIAFGVVPFLVVTIAALLLLKIQYLNMKENFGRTLAFSYIGIFLGMFTGGSKEPVVAAMLPAAIGLIASFTVYFFEKKSAEDKDISAASLSAALCALVVSASFGTYYASNIRALSLRKERAIELNSEVDKFKKIEMEVKLNRVKFCLEMFAAEPEIRKSCAELLKAK